MVRNTHNAGNRVRLFRNAGVRMREGIRDVAGCTGETHGIARISGGLGGRKELDVSLNCERVRPGAIGERDRAEIWLPHSPGECE